MLTALVLAAITVLTGEGHCAMQPVRIETEFPTEDVVIASLTVQAPGDGQSDATAAIQAAIDEAVAARGGVVFLPSGRYRLEGPLVIKEGVTLRGDWQRPVQDSGAKGTVLMPVHGRGEAAGAPAITIERGSGIREVSVWYPDQDPEAIVPYPWAIKTSPTVAGDNYTVHNVTLYNPYLGIQVGPEWNELHTIRNVFGTPLKTGLSLDTTTDIGRLINVDFGPHWWEQSGLPGAPQTDPARAALQKSMMAEGVGMDMGRSDWEYIHQVRLSGYAVGFRFRAGAQGTANAVMFGCKALGCKTGLLAEALNGIGLSATACQFEGLGHAVWAPGGFDAIVQLHSCRIVSTAGSGAALDGSGWLTFQNCEFVKWADRAIWVKRGNVSVVGCRFGKPESHAFIGSEAGHARFIGNTCEGDLQIEDQAERGDVQVLGKQADFDLPDVSPHPAKPDPRPATDRVFVVGDFGAAPDAEDNTVAFQQALAAAGAAGGGTVYVPAGNYRFAGNLTVPSGVELRGIFDVPHHTISGGSVLMPTAGKGQETGEPFVALQANSGVRGLTLWYPEQDLNTVFAYPWTIQSRGTGCWVVDIACGNSYQGVDFGSYPSAGHLIRYLSGCFLRRGLYVSKSDGEGWIEDTQFNPHYSARIPDYLPRPYAESPWDPTLDYMFRNLEGIVLGRCADEHVRGTFLYAAYDGIAFRDDNGGANARLIQHGTDAGSRGVLMEATGDRGVEFINGQIVHFGPKEQAALVTEPGFNGTVKFFNTQMWAGPKSGIIQGSGNVLIQQLNTLTGPFEVTGGNFTLANAHFARDLSPAVKVGPDANRATLIGNVCGGVFRIGNEAGDKLHALANSLSLPPRHMDGETDFATGFEEADPQPLADTVATVGGGLKSVSGPTCRVTEDDAHSGKRALRIAGNAEDPGYSYVYFRILEQPLATWPDTVLSYTVRPVNERGMGTFVDLLFNSGRPLRDTGARMVGGQSARVGAGIGKVGEWAQVVVPVGRVAAGKTITGIMLAYDSRSGGGPFEALIDDLRVFSAMAHRSWQIAATPAGGVQAPGTQVSLAGPEGSGIRYTADGTAPGKQSALYEGPITLDRPGAWDLRFVAQAPDGELAPVVMGALYEVGVMR